MTNKKPLLLITNDDGINAPGLRKLISLMRPLGEVVVVASEKIMSGMAHAVTIQDPLRVKLVTEEEDYKEYMTNGTPSDNVKLAKYQLLERLPDLVVSGINHGSNASINIIYSGTMAAVLEATIDGIPGIGFSLLDYSHDADFSHVDKYIVQIVRKVLDEGMPDDIGLNVNIPKVSDTPLKGIKVCRQAKARWVEDFDTRKDPYGREYFWMTGNFVNGDPALDTDQKALEENYVSVVPVHVDFTAHKYVEKLNFN
ncbi:MAG: 5'/3'-nucleotidase SurE [Bacteroidetes bacterium]|nr:MAG: 5'/3'-nucleotidase SurE [Bacteroidota bacterium]